MEPVDFWKNFQLGEELHISGVFIYNGLRRFHELRQLDFTDELFEFLYNLSVGFERLLKTAVVLYEQNDATNQEELEKSLITHNHLDLASRIQRHMDLRLGKSHHDLLGMLGTFYKTHRYDRFALSSVFNREKETKAIKELLAKYLQTKFSKEITPFGTSNDDQYRNFIRKTALKIARNVYRAINDRASHIGLYTYELRHGSKAESVYMREVNIADEDTLWKELLIFLMNTKEDSGYLRFLREIKPLEFDPGLLPDYLDCFKSDSFKAGVMDELEFHYEEMDRDERKERLSRIGVIGAPNVCFDDEDEDEDEEIDDAES